MSNSAQLKLGLFSFSQMPRNSTVFRFLSQLEEEKLTVFGFQHVGKADVILVLNANNRHFCIFYINSAILLSL